MNNTLTTEGNETMTYKQAKSRLKKYCDVNTYIDYIYKYAKTDKGMTARDTAKFHLYNPNGSADLCREWGYKAFKEGNFVLGIFAARHDSYYVEKLGECAKKVKPRWRDVNYYVDGLYKEAVDWAEKVKEVENRTDEEKEWVENFLNSKTVAKEGGQS